MKAYQKGEIVQLANHEIAGILIAQAERHEAQAARCRATAATLQRSALRQQFRATEARS